MQQRTCPAAATAGSYSSPPAAPRTWPADGGPHQGRAENIPLPPPTFAVCLPAPVGVLPGADAPPPPTSAPRYGPSRPVPQPADAVLRQSVLCANRPRPSGPAQAPGQALSLRLDWRPSLGAFEQSLYLPVLVRLAPNPAGLSPWPIVG